MASDSIYTITLIVQDDMGCADTTHKNIWIFNDYWMWIPNSFTPDNERPNNRFCITCDGVEKENFMFHVYNRFSVLIYSTNNLDDIKCVYDGAVLIDEYGWDGKHKNTGVDLPAGIYLYEINYTYVRNNMRWTKQDMGYIQLVR